MNWTLFEDPPQPGTRFVALYSDGSGASVYFFREDGHVLLPSGEEMGEALTPAALSDWLWDAGYLFWMPMPEWQKLFFEEVGG